MCPQDFYRLVFRSEDSLDLQTGSRYDFVLQGLPNTKRYKVVCDEVHIFHDAFVLTENNIELDALWEIKTNFGVNNLLDSSRGSTLSVFPEKGNNLTMTLLKETHPVVCDKPQGNNFHFEILADGAVLNTKLDFVISFVFQPYEDE